MNQHEFVTKCFEKYKRLGIILGDPNEESENQMWQNAHYPAPDPEGDTTIPMLFDDHQQQGLYQSEEYGRCCFFIGHTRKFLTHGPFVENWFELWDLYDKWSPLQFKKLHIEKDENGKSIFGVESGKKSHLIKNEEGKSANAVANANKLHEEKNKEGKSPFAIELGKKRGKKPHEKKNEEGKSVLAVKNGKNACEKIHAKKNEEGKSILGIENAKRLHKQRWMNTDPNWPPFISTSGPLTLWQKARGIDIKCRIRVITD